MNLDAAPTRVGAHHHRGRQIGMVGEHVSTRAGGTLPPLSAAWHGKHKKGTVCTGKDCAHTHEAAEAGGPCGKRTEPNLPMHTQEAAGGGPGRRQNRKEDRGRWPCTKTVKALRTQSNKAPQELLAASQVQVSMSQSTTSASAPPDPLRGSMAALPTPSRSATMSQTTTHSRDYDAQAPIDGNANAAHCRATSRGPYHTQHPAGWPVAITTSPKSRETATIHARTS